VRPAAEAVLVSVAKLHLTKDLDTADAAEVAWCIIPLQEPADDTTAPVIWMF